MFVLARVLKVRDNSQWNPAGEADTMPDWYIRLARMNRRATYLWAWIAVFAQIFLGGVPVVSTASEECRAVCCAGESGEPGCCDLAVSDEPCCPCCSAESTEPVVPAVPLDPTASVKQWWTPGTIAVSLDPSAARGGFDRTVTGLMIASRGERGFLESRLRV